MIQRKPEWLKIRPPSGEDYNQIKGLARSLELHTVCEEAHCPNVAECWGGGTATFMLLGDVCTRGCRFCAVHSGNPRGKVDADEPQKVSRAVSVMGLDYVVLTSVDRDDLSDGGAQHFADSVRAIKNKNSAILVEVLIPDFQGDESCLKEIANSGCEVIAHNIETVRRLTPAVRDRRATYDQSLAVLEWFKQKQKRHLYTKSSLMLGLGESREEILETMDNLRGRQVDVLTLGQYLKPTYKHVDVHRFVSPQEFDELREIAEQKGFLYVASGPLVRSSYRAGEFFMKGLVKEGGNLSL